VKIAEEMKQVSAALEGTNSGFLVKSQGMTDEEPDEKETQEYSQMKERGKDFLGVASQEMTEANSKSPNDSYQRPCLRGISGPLRQERINEDIRSC